jgi:hypothetical protein
MNRPIKVRLPTIHESVDLVFEDETEDKYAVSIDMTGWFGQIPCLGKWLRVKVKRSPDQPGTVLVWTVLPQGWSWSPIIAQTISEHLLGDLCVKGIIYDNYLLSGSYDQVLRDTETFLARCEAVNAEVKQNKSVLSPSREVIHCGVELNLKENTYRNDPEWAAKVAHLFLLCERAKFITNRQTYELAGKAMHLLNVRKIPFASHRPVLTAMSVVGRRVQRGHSWEEKFEINEALRASLAKLRAILEKNEPIRWTGWHEKMWHTYVDASTTWGMGWVTFDDEGNLVGSDHRPWTKEEEELAIHDMEAFGLREAWSWTQKLLPANTGTTFYIDNTVEHGSVRKGHSKSINIDRVIRDMLPMKTRLVRIPTEFMIADPTSRGMTPSEVKEIAHIFELEHKIVTSIVAQMNHRECPLPAGEFDIVAKKIDWRRE